LKRILFSLCVVAKFVPVIVTGTPASPIVGVNPVMLGALGLPTVKELLLVADPEGEVTLIGPVVAPAGTVATILVAENGVKSGVDELWSSLIVFNPCRVHGDDGQIFILDFIS